MNAAILTIREESDKMREGRLVRYWGIKSGKIRKVL